MASYLVSTPPGGAVARTPFSPILTHTALYLNGLLVSNGTANKQKASFQTSNSKTRVSRPFVWLTILSGPSLRQPAFKLRLSFVACISD